MASVCTALILYHLDQAWRLHLGDMADLESCISLRTAGGRQAFIEFQKQAFDWFVEQQHSSVESAVSAFNELKSEDGELNLAKAGITSPSSTWTYQINDAMFDDSRNVLLGQPGLAAGIVFYAGPLLLLQLWVAKRLKRK